VSQVLQQNKIKWRNRKMIEVSKHKVTGCNLLHNDMLHNVVKYRVLYVGFLSYRNIELLVNEMNTIFSNTAEFLNVDKKEAYYDNNENIIALK
jgi:hypothetical protein